MIKSEWSLLIYVVCFRLQMAKLNKQSPPIGSLQCVALKKAVVLMKLVRYLIHHLIWTGVVHPVTIPLDVDRQ